MQMFLAIIALIVSLVLIVSVILQDGKDAGMGSAFGADEKLFGKTAAKGLQATLQRITVVSAVVFMLVIFIMGVMFR